MRNESGKRFIFTIALAGAAAIGCKTTGGRPASSQALAISGGADEYAGATAETAPYQKKLRIAAADLEPLRQEFLYARRYFVITKEYLALLRQSVLWRLQNPTAVEQHKKDVNTACVEIERLATTFPNAKVAKAVNLTSDDPSKKDLVMGNGGVCGGTIRGGLSASDPGEMKRAQVGLLQQVALLKKVGADRIKAGSGRIAAILASDSSDTTGTVAWVSRERLQELQDVLVNLQNPNRNQYPTEFSWLNGTWWPTIEGVTVPFPGGDPSAEFDYLDGYTNRYGGMLFGLDAFNTATSRMVSLNSAALVGAFEVMNKLNPDYGQRFVESIRNDQTLLAKASIKEITWQYNTANRMVAQEVGETVTLLNEWTAQLGQYVPAPAPKRPGVICFAKPVYSRGGSLPVNELNTESAEIGYAQQFTGYIPTEEGLVGGIKYTCPKLTFYDMDPEGQLIGPNDTVAKAEELARQECSDHTGHHRCKINDKSQSGCVSLISACPFKLQGE